MNLGALKRIYFIGAGGIGMSALARYFNDRAVCVSGYDRTPTALTQKLIGEGIAIHFTDDIERLDKDAELVVYTPAIPKDHKELNWYRNNNYAVYKRSDVLQWITRDLFSITVAGTHGKTTISTMIAYLLRETNYGCNAFLGGISVNYDTNYWSSTNQVAVVEADEYDRSFLKLLPDIAVLTAIDPDHLDIYGTPEAMEEAFIQYTKNIKASGTLLLKHGLHRDADLKASNKITYSLTNEAANVYATNLLQQNGTYTFTAKGSTWEIKELCLPIGGLHNVENALAAIAVTQLLGINPEKVKQALAGFKGIKRRFEYVLSKEQIVFIDDYAHHPQELAALIHSAKSLFPGRKCMVVFQPHLFSRTADLAEGFATSLDLADEVVLLDIYPARELPVPGITSQIILDRMKNRNACILSKDAMMEYVVTTKPELLITAGAGDIDKLVLPLKDILSKAK
jgi:UDP-N-acetylmuramate--alanine ligase